MEEYTINMANGKGEHVVVAGAQKLEPLSDGM